MKRKNSISNEEQQFRIEVSVRLCNIRKNLGYSQEKFSEKLEIPYTTYRKYEQCASTISNHVLWRLGREYGFFSDASIRGDNEEILPLYEGKTKNRIERDKDLKFRLTHIRAELKEVEKYIGE